MELNHYLEQDAHGDLVIRGTRVDLATVVEAFHDGFSPEEIAYNYPSADLAAVYATLAHYLENQSKIDEALGKDSTVLEARRRAHQTPKVVQRLRDLSKR